MTAAQRHSAAMSALHTARAVAQRSEAELAVAFTSSLNLIDSVIQQPGWALANVSTPEQAISVMNGLRGQIETAKAQKMAERDAALTELERLAALHGPDEEADEPA